MRFLLAVAAVLTLSGCAGESISQSALDFAHTDTGDPVARRYQTASIYPLGTQDDLAGIKRAITARHPEMNIVEIRWVSATEAMAFLDCNRNTSVGYESYLCTLKKHRGAWLWVDWHLELIS